MVSAIKSRARDHREWQDMCVRVFRPAICHVSKVSGFGTRPMTPRDTDLTQLEPVQYNTRQQGGVFCCIIPLCGVLYGETDI